MKIIAVSLVVMDVVSSTTLKNGKDFCDYNKKYNLAPTANAYVYETLNFAALNKIPAGEYLKCLQHDFNNKELLRIVKNNLLLISKNKT
ncbi:hypothetical protein [Abyssogena phaseoliformis symbiont]|uniref:hypothetical protein n=1 Tax=Abyssogena phaseoliformis symbiont TaxID=596095 RepID=UPI001CECC3F8|nr:hypothetical protein [Abyssogena phaseoliformis symbiont]